MLNSHAVMAHEIAELRRENERLKKEVQELDDAEDEHWMRISAWKNDQTQQRKQIKELTAERDEARRENADLRDALGCEICDWEFKGKHFHAPTVLCPECHKVYMIQMPRERDEAKKELERAKAEVDIIHAMCYGCPKLTENLTAPKPEGVVDDDRR
jgi:uncharacterized coiled-coil DUF342 family protein